MTSIAFAAVALTTGWIGLGTGAVVRLTRQSRNQSRKRTSSERLAGVTVLKPLHGADPCLRQNLESFFTQDHPAYELLFGVERADDPAIAVARSLMADHPLVNAQIIIVHTALRGENPKVRNLRGIVASAAFDLVLISDSNVRAPTGYLSDAVRVLQDHPANGLVTNIFIGSGGGTLGADLEAVQLAGFCATGTALPTLAGDAAVVGKSMLFSRSTFERLGGFARVADVLAEDYVIGKMFQHGGLRVVIAPTVLENVLGPITVRQFLDRQLRWSMLRCRLRPSTFLLEPLTSPLAVLPLAWSFMGAWALVWMFTLLFIRDVITWIALRGRATASTPLALSIVREILTLAIWAAAPFTHHASWRGHRFRVGAGTLLFRDGARRTSPERSARART